MSTDVPQDQRCVVRCEGEPRRKSTSLSDVLQAYHFLQFLVADANTKDPLARTKKAVEVNMLRNRRGS